MKRARSSRQKSSRAGRKPKYRRQRRQGFADLAFVELGGRRYYLGPFGTKESRREYRRLLVEWEASGGEIRSTGTAAPANETTVLEIIARFWEHARVYSAHPDELDPHREL